MAGRPWEHADQARAALKAIIDDPNLGVTVLSSGRLAANVLEDLLPEAPRERAILVLAAQAGVAQALRDHVTQGLDDATAISLAIVSLEDNSPLDHDSCEWVVTQIAAAIGLAAARPLAAEPATRLVPAPADPLQAAATVTARAPAPAPRPTPLSLPTPPPEPKRRKRRRTAVNCAAFSADGRLLANGADDGSASVWDVASGALVRRFAGHHGQVLAAVFSPDGRFLATAAAGDVARLWNLASGALERDVTPGSAWHVAFSPDGQLLATAGGGRSQPAGVAAPAVAEVAARFWHAARWSGSWPGMAARFRPWRSAPTRACLPRPRGTGPRACGTSGRPTCRREYWAADALLGAASLAGAAAVLTAIAAGVTWVVAASAGSSLAMDARIHLTDFGLTSIPLTPNASLTPPSPRPRRQPCGRTRPIAESTARGRAEGRRAGSAPSA